MRVVSFLPTGTEILLALGAGEDLVGISHENLQIPAVRHLPLVSGLTYDEQQLTGAEIDRLVSETYARGESIYRIDEPLLRELRPELLVTQALCDVCAITPNDFQRVLGRMDPAPEVLELNAHTVGEALEDVERTARAVRREAAGKRLRAAMQARIDAVAGRAAAAAGVPRVFCLEWPDPLYNSGHWVPELVRLAGGREVLGREGEYSGKISWEALEESDPEVMVAMVCGFPRERAIEELRALERQPGFARLRAVRTNQFWVVDGPKYFSQSGPGLVDGLEILARILHPEIFGEPEEEPAVRYAFGVER